MPKDTANIRYLPLVSVQFCSLLVNYEGYRWSPLNAAQGRAIALNLPLVSAQFRSLLMKCEGYRWSLLNASRTHSLPHRVVRYGSFLLNAARLLEVCRWIPLNSARRVRCRSFPLGNGPSGPRYDSLSSAFSHPHLPVCFRLLARCVQYRIDQIDAGTAESGRSNADCGRLKADVLAKANHGRFKGR